MTLVVTSRPVLLLVLSQVAPYVVFKRHQVQVALRILERIRPGMDVQEFLEVARQVDAFAALSHSKTKRYFAADVEQHLRGMGVLAPVTTLSWLSERMESSTDR